MKILDAADIKALAPIGRKVAILLAHKAVHGVVSDYDEDLRGEYVALGRVRIYLADVVGVRREDI